MSMRLFCIFDENGLAVATSLLPPRHEAERPPPNDYQEGHVGAEVMLTVEDTFDDEADQMRTHFELHEWLRGFRFNGDQLEGPGAPEVLVRSRMKNGVLQDKTTKGWRSRAIFEPELDENGEEVEGPDGFPEGRWFVMGPRRGEKPNFIVIEKPDPGDRRVWKGYQGNEITEE